MDKTQRINNNENNRQQQEQEGVGEGIPTDQHTHTHTHVAWGKGGRCTQHKQEHDKDEP